MDQIWRQPIFWLDIHGRPATSFFEKAMPFTYVDLSGDEQKWTRTLALVDTGCIGTMLTRALFEKLNAKPTVRTEMSGNWSRQEVQFFSVSMRYSECPAMLVPCHAGELRLDTDQAHVQALIGIDTLRFGTLTLPPPPEAGFLEIRANQLQAWQSGVGQ